MARYCDSAHVAAATWRTKVHRSSSGQTTAGWCDECKSRLLAESGTTLTEKDFEAIGQPPDEGTPMNSQKGFTLIELMIVVTIIGILAAIAIPKFAQMRAESYKKEHGHYPEGYTPSEQRNRQVESLDTVKRVHGTIDYFYDPKTELCFAHYSNGCVTVVPCDRVLPLLTPTTTSKGSF